MGELDGGEKESKLLKPLLFSASSQENFALVNLSSSLDRLESLACIIIGNCVRTEGGWLDCRFIYNRSLFGLW